MRNLKHPLTDSISDADPQLLTPLLESFLLADSMVDVTQIELEFLVRFIAVYRYTGRSRADNGLRSGWIVCGSIPFLTFNDDEIATPMEALALYA